MCTVSYLPLQARDFILTSNRDETAARGLSSAPILLQCNDISVICPVDPLANGTWIAAGDNGLLVCLLNGAFRKHHHQPPYRKSRGLVVLDSFNYDSPEAFVNEYDLSNIEPFTMVIVSSSERLQLRELRWDGQQKFFRRLNEEAFHLWSSVTLYSEEVSLLKEKAFKKHLKLLAPSLPLQLIDIHRQYFLYEDWVKPPTRVQQVATLSATAVHGNVEMMQLFYRDLVRKEVPLETICLPLKHAKD